MTEGSIFVRCFGGLKDFRMAGKTKYDLFEVIALTICAVIAGADSWTDVEDYGNEKLAMLRRFLVLESGIPSHDTIGRIFSLLDSKKLGECFVKWAAETQVFTQGKLISIDGKTLRRSFDKTSGKGALHMVGAWVKENGIALGQMGVDEKTNEITAIPELIKMLDLKGAVVTIDAGGTHKPIAAAIIDGGGDYVLALKDNHPTLKSEVEAFFKDNIGKKDGPSIDFFETIDKGYGRIETRRCFMAEIPKGLYGASSWKNLKTIVMVESERIVGNAEAKYETQYFISSLDVNAKTALPAVRGHWSIENSLHWVLDIAFREDECRIRTGHAAENLASIRRLALSLLKRDKTRKCSIKAKRKIAAWNDDFMLEVMKQLI